MPEADLVHVENLNLLTSDAARAAYLYIVRMAERLPGYRCYPAKSEPSGNHFEFHDVSGQPYLLGLAPEGLLFQFRKADIKAYAPPEALASRLTENESGEVEIHITSLAQAQELMRAVFDLNDTSHIRTAA